MVLVSPEKRMLASSDSMRRETGDAIEFATDPRVRIICESAWSAARREYRKEIIDLVESMAKEASDTGYGKAQRRFAKLLVSRLETK